VAANNEVEKIWFVEDWFDMSPGTVLGMYRDPAKARECFDAEAASKFWEADRKAGRLTEDEDGTADLTDDKGWHALRLYYKTFND
jgi:hypothetical protein